MNKGAFATTSVKSRLLGAWWGLFIGDAIALPSHGYYNLRKLAEDYGTLSDYAAPHEPHPHSDLHRLITDSADGPADCLHHRRALWKRPGTHYHHGMAAGDNTLPAILAIKLAQSLGKKGRLDRDDWLEDYQRILLTPDGHHDCYIPTAHRTFVENINKGLPPEKCAAQDCHISGLVEAAPIMLMRANDADALVRELGQHIRLTHECPPLIRAGILLGEIIRLLLAGASIEDACFKYLGHHHHPYLAFPYHRWITNHTDEHMATHELNQGPTGDDAVPLALFLSLKYADNFERAVSANAALGGDSCHRGALVGLILGAVHGLEGLPPRLVNGLINRRGIEAAGEILWKRLNAAHLAKAA